MQDNRIIVLLTRKIAGEITADEMEELTDLLAKQPDAVYYDEFLKELWKDRKIPNEKVNHAYERHKLRYQDKWTLNDAPIIKATGSARKNRGKVSKNVWYASAAIVLCTVCLGLFLMKQQVADKQITPEEKIEIVAEKGVRKKLTLPDGTKIWLNADSRLSYNNFSKSKKRLVHLKGEAYFDVAKNEKKPFVIETDKISIQVLGTAFNVKAYPDEKKTETTLIKGAIALSVNERPNEKILLKPSEKLAVIDNKSSHKKDRELASTFTLTIGNLSKVSVDNTEYIQETSWIDNKLVFKDETMSELIPKIERWYNVEIVLENPKVNTYRYTGTITKENINQMLKAMQLIKSFNYKIENDNEIIIY